MEQPLNLLEETIEHFSMGAKSVTAYSNSSTYVIKRVGETDEYVVTEEEAGFTKTKTSTLDSYFSDVFGIEARY